VHGVIHTGSIPVSFPNGIGALTSIINRTQNSQVAKLVDAGGADKQARVLLLRLKKGLMMVRIHH